MGDVKLLAEEFYKRVDQANGQELPQELPMVVGRSDGWWDIATWTPNDPDHDPLLSEDHHHGAEEHVVRILTSMRAVSEHAVRQGKARKPAGHGLRVVGSPGFHHDPEYEGGEVVVSSDEHGNPTEIVNIWARAYRRVHELGSQVFFSFDGGELGREPRYLSVNPHKEYGAFDADPDERIKRMVAYIAEMDAGRFEDVDIPNALDDAD